MTSHPSSHYHITDAHLKEALFRADRLLNGQHRSTTLGELQITSGTHSLDIWWNGKHAFCYWKPEEGSGPLDGIRKACDWAPTALRAALAHMRALTVLDDLADV